MGLLLAITAALLALLVAGQVTGAGSETAASHPLFAPMQRGIDGGTLGAPVWTGYAAGLLIIGMMWVAVQVGFREHGWIRLTVAGWTLWYASAFVALMRAFAAYETGRTEIVAGFTEPAAWMVYGIGLSPWVLLLIVTWAFPRVYFGADEQARFDEIVARSRETMIVRAGPDRPLESGGD